MIWWQKPPTHRLQLIQAHPSSLITLGLLYPHPLDHSQVCLFWSKTRGWLRLPQPNAGRKKRKKRPKISFKQYTGCPKKRVIKNINFLTQYLGLQAVLRNVFVLKINLWAYTLWIFSFATSEPHLKLKFGGFIITLIPPKAQQNLQASSNIWTLSF